MTTDSNDKRRCVVDTHAHVYPARYLDQLEKVGVSSASTAKRAT